MSMTSKDAKAFMELQHKKLLKKGKKGSALEEAWKSSIYPLLASGDIESEDYLEACKKLFRDSSTEATPKCTAKSTTKSSSSSSIGSDPCSIGGRVARYGC